MVTILQNDTAENAIILARQGKNGAGDTFLLDNCKE
jgi:hypothetical protein